MLELFVWLRCRTVVYWKSNGLLLGKDTAADGGTQIGHRDQSNSDSKQQRQDKNEENAKEKNTSRPAATTKRQNQRNERAITPRHTLRPCNIINAEANSTHHADRNERVGGPDLVDSQTKTNEPKTRKTGLDTSNVDVIARRSSPGQCVHLFFNDRGNHIHRNSERSFSHKCLDFLSVTAP